MSGHRPWSEIRRGPPGSWNRVAGDDRALHYFRDTTRPEWWRSAVCSAGPAVGKSESDAKLEICTTCMPADEQEVTSK